MTLHYHGTPITPISQLMTMEGRNFCISYARPDDLKRCLSIGQSLMLDNGAFSAFTKGFEFDEDGFYQWVEPVLSHPHWCVVPDVIGGDEFDNFQRMQRYPFDKDKAMPVWHLHLSTDYLLRLLQCGFKGVCFGSSAEYWQVGSDKWRRRMDEAFNRIAQHHKKMPWVHGLRMMNMCVEGDYPLASVDSTNVAQNYKARTCCPEKMASQIDAKQTPLFWEIKAEQQELIA